MKNKNQLLFCGALLLSMLACNNNTGSKQATADGYSINGKIAGLHSGGIKLVSYNDDDRTSKTIDSIAFNNDTFHLKGKLNNAQMMTLFIEPGGWSMPVFVENTIISIDADTTASQHYDDTKYGGTAGAVINKYSISGSQGQDEWMKYQKDPGQKRFDSAFAPLERALNIEKDIDKEYKIRDQIDSVRKLQNDWKQNWINDFADKNPSSAAGIYMLSELYRYYSTMPIISLEASLNKFSSNLKTSPYYKSISASLYKRKALLPGQIAPDFTLLKKDSSSFTLTSTRGKYIMIDFWASWCHPCRQAIPHWKEVYKKYHTKGFEIVSVSDDSRWADWIKAMDVEKMPWLQVVDEFPIKNMPAKVGTLYMTSFIPFYVLIDKDGKIILYTDNENEIDAKLKELIG